MIMSNNIPILIAMALYMLLVIYIGVKFGRKNKNSEDYFLGGRRLGPWVTAMSAEASDMSSWLLMGLPGVAFATGFGSAGWTAIGLIIGTYLNWKIIALRLRSYTEVNHSITLPQFFTNRYKDDKNILASIAAVMILIFFCVYTASGFAACGTLFNTTFGLPYVPSMIICGIVIVLYTSIGGFLAASTTDFIQGLLMSFAIVIVMIVGFVAAGGPAAVIEHGASLPGYFSILKTYDPTTQAASTYGIIEVISGLAWGLGYFGVPHVLIRFMAIKDKKELKRSRSIAMIWVVISLAVAVIIGFIGCALYSDVAELQGSGNQRIFIYMTQHLFRGLLPSFLAGLILSGILAATMSTSDSQLLIASSCVSKDIYQAFSKKPVSEKKLLVVSRITTIVIAIIAIIIAFDENSSVFNLVSNAWAGFGAAFGPLILFSLFWKRTNLKGAVAGMISGGLIALIFPMVHDALGLSGIWDIYVLLPAFIISSIFIVVVSLLTEKPSQEIVDEFEAAKTMTSSNK
ncbi:MAG: sodium/proline symporter PutP [Lachnospiraceae bacterium]